METTIIPAAPHRPRPVYEPALGLALRGWLFVIFALVAFLGATGVYLLAIRSAEAIQHETLQTQFSVWMTFAHVAGGLLLVVPFLGFGTIHLVTARKRPNRVAVRLGIVVLLLGLAIGITGILLIRLEGLPQLPTETPSYWTAFALHAALPLLAIFCYVLHRRAGPPIQWRWGYAWGSAVAAFVTAMMVLHAHNPRQWLAKGSPEGEKYFEPSRARTVDGNFISAQALLMDEYCMKCHADIYGNHIHSVHKFSSFNNPAYLFSVRETRRTAGVRASRWCAGCHDPVPFFSGAFDDPQFDDSPKNPTAQAGVTCVVCHSITHVNSRSGNGDYTIEEPQHYPFAYSDNAALQWINNQLVKAKPELHKKTFLKPFHRSEEFCSTCHKVGLPQEVNHYKEFLRGQNHSDSYYLSGVSGHGARSFYYPKEAKTSCAQCHMPLEESSDFGARDFDGSGRRTIHSHAFAAANTGLHALLGYPGCEKSIEAAASFVKNGPDGKSPTLRIDLFGIKHLSEPGQGVAAPLIDDQPLRPHLPALRPGESYLVDVVIRTLNMGHHFTQGTADSNEVWVEFVARCGGRVLGQSGALPGNDEGPLDAGAHTLNVLMLDRHGNRIDRRNPQDIFTPLYDHQIGPGAAQVVHYRLDLPRDLSAPVELSVRVRYRKFDHAYMEKVYGPGKVPRLPIVDLCADRVLLPVVGGADQVAAQQAPITPPWQRWNDYGIACFLEGGPEGKSGGELGQAERAFARLLAPEFKAFPEAPAHAHLNLARVHLAYGGSNLEQARAALIQARACNPPAPWWTVAWFNGLVNMQNVNFPEAIAQFELILDPARQDPKRRFDFTSDWVVINELGKALFFSAQQEEQTAPRTELLRRAIARFEQTLMRDAENTVAHEFLAKSYARLAGSADSSPSAAAALDPELRACLDRIADIHAAEAARYESARELTRRVAALQAPPLPVLLHLHRHGLALYRGANSLERRLALAPAITDVDRRLLASLPELGRAFTDARLSTARRLEAAAGLVETLGQLNQRLPQENTVPSLLSLSCLPGPGQTVSLALLGTAQLGHLQGPLPPPRLLPLNALRAQLRPLVHNGDPQIQAATARVMGRVHLVMHGIFRPDDNAQDTAVRRYRAAHPAADRASQAIAIYELKERP